jgi:hypothetical protein
MDALALGDPSNAFTDIGPVIDADACAMLEAHVAAMDGPAKILHRAPLGEDWAGQGRFFAPTLIEIDPILISSPRRSSARSCTCCATSGPTCPRSPSSWRTSITA